MRRRLLATIALVLGAWTAGAPTAGASAVGIPPAGHTLLVVGQSGAGPVDAFATGARADPAGGMWYVGPYEDQATVDGVLGDIDAAVAARPGLVVNLGVSFGSISTPTAPYTGAIAAGAYDATLHRMAAWLKRLPTIAYLRLGYEFDLLGGQYGPAELYKAAYRHIVDVFRADGVTNAVYVWHSAGAFWRASDPSLFAVGSGTVAETARGLLPAPANDPQPITAFYPGRDYVDLFGISYWEDGCCFGRSSAAARAVYEARTREILSQARDLGLPAMIAESTPAYVGADSGADSVAWLDQAFHLVRDFDIRVWSLISIDWDDGGFFSEPFWNGYWPDARIAHYPATCRRMVGEINSSDRYVLRTPDLPSRLGLGGAPAPFPSPLQAAAGPCA